MLSHVLCLTYGSSGKYRAAANTAVLGFIVHGSAAYQASGSGAASLRVHPRVPFRVRIAPPWRRRRLTYSEVPVTRLHAPLFGADYYCGKHHNKTMRFRDLPTRARELHV